MVPMITADSGLPYKNARSPVTASAVFADGPSELAGCFRSDGHALQSAIARAGPPLLRIRRQNGDMP